MPSSPLATFLQLMENPVNVVIASLIVIAIRVAWASYRKRHPLPAPPAEVQPRVRWRKPKADAQAGAAKVPARRRDPILELIDTVLIAVILVFGLVRPLLLQTFFIPSASMEPTLLGPYNPAQPEKFMGSVVTGPRRSGDKLIANRFVLHFRAPRRGEVIVFQPPLGALEGNNYQYIWRRWLREHPGEWQRIAPESMTESQLLARLPEPPTKPEDFIKRVIGVPGDHIRIDPDKGVYVNGKLQREPYVPQHLPQAAEEQFPRKQVPPGDPPTLQEILQVTGGRQAEEQFQIELLTWMRAWYQYEHLYKDNIGPNLDGNEFVVPPDSVFVMGDNRSPGGSFDSRYWGVVPLKNIKARAVATFWPLQRIKLL